METNDGKLTAVHEEAAQREQGNQDIMHCIGVASGYHDAGRDALAKQELIEGLGISSTDAEALLQAL